MKLMIMMLALITNLAFAVEIEGSDYSKRHIKALDRAIINNCGYLFDYVLVSSEEEVIQIDQGTRDVKYRTILSAVRRIDQGISDNYRISILSEYADHYDHVEKDWGSYSVQYVRCDLVD